MKPAQEHVCYLQLPLHLLIFLVRRLVKVQPTAHLEHGALRSEEVPVMFEKGGGCSRNLQLTASASPETLYLQLEPRVSRCTAPKSQILQTSLSCCATPCANAAALELQRKVGFWGAQPFPGSVEVPPPAKPTFKKSKQRRASKFPNLGRGKAPARKERAMQWREGTGGPLLPLKAFAASLQLAVINCGQSAISSLV